MINAQTKISLDELFVVNFREETDYKLVYNCRLICNENGRPVIVPIYTKCVKKLTPVAKKKAVAITNGNSLP